MEANQDRGHAFEKTALKQQQQHWTTVPLSETTTTTATQLAAEINLRV